MKILFADSVHPLLQYLLEQKKFSCMDASTWSEQEIKRNIHEYQGLVIRSRFPVNHSFLEQASSLKFIARFGAGMENIDVSFAQSKNIACLNAPEGNSNAVAEHALGMLLALMNNLLKADREVRKGQWLREENRGSELDGKTVGIIGFGNTGSAFAKKLTGFEVPVFVYDKYINVDEKKFSHVKQVAMSEIFNHADVLSLHLPLTDETKNLVNDEFMDRFQKNIILINTSRGIILPLDSLERKMKSGKITGACLDVFEFEDTSFEKVKPETHPAFDFLKKSDRVILSPHIAGWTVESNEKIARALAEKICQLAGFKD